MKIYDLGSSVRGAEIGVTVQGPKTLGRKLLMLNGSQKGHVMQYEGAYLEGLEKHCRMVSGPVVEAIARRMAAALYR